MFVAERVRLRRIEKADLPHYVEWLNDAEVRRGLKIFLPLSNVEEDEWFETMMKSPLLERPYAIDAKAGEGWAHIGSCALFGFDHTARQAELGIVIGDKDYWNKGYGSDVMRLLLKVGFETLNLNRIHLWVYGNNPRARHVYEKIGFTHEGSLRQHIFREGQYYDVHMMGILRDEWQAMNK
ncbi:MAG: N-acetyltransferase [Anaerolineae bacterium]|nr:MAG: N-acetyltransferase [Anaerolineae bacterium]